MSVTLGADGVIRLAGDCPIEDAEVLLRLLSGNPDAEIDWTLCDQAHTAVIQVLMAARRPIVGSPTNLFFSEHLESLLGNG